MAQPTCGDCGRFPNHRPGSPVCVARSRDEWRDRAERAESRVKELETALALALSAWRLIAPDAEKRSPGFIACRAALDGKKAAPGHLGHYLSTACHHERHADCRLACKFCEERCVCSCHVAGAKP